MSIQRRSFLKNSSLFAGGLLFLDPIQKISRLSGKSKGMNQTMHSVPIFHTNDLHNQLLPHKKGYGGLYNIATVLDKENISCLLLDAGDFLDQRASPEQHLAMIQQMNRMDYQAATIGNRELALGQSALSELVKKMNFPLVNCNYSFSESYLQSSVVPYHIVSWSGYRIGITGVGTLLNRRIATTEKIVFHHPYQRANAVAAYLKKNCDFVICLSHLGYEKNKTGYNSLDLALASENIDLVISGHHDDLIAAPRIVRNQSKKEVILSHGGERGLIGRHLTIGFNDQGQKNFISCRNYVPSQKVKEPFYEGFEKIRGVV
ncbi:MAG: metallophosphoesterase [Flavisolibacter sp.]